MALFAALLRSFRLPPFLHFLLLLPLHFAFAQRDLSPSLPPSPVAFRPQISSPSDSLGRPSAAFAAHHFSLDDFAHSLRIEKDHQDPSRLLDVFLPASFGHFRQFIARVTDISIVDEPRIRDANRTFLASLADSSVINVHGLSPGHKYNVAILGRREAESSLIREDQVLMDPVPLDFGVPANSTAIIATATNVTMRAQKPDRALQDTFRVEYHQLDPLKRFPILDVHDIQEQREVELYLGNLSPGRDYAVSITSLREELPSQPWRGVVTTKPLRPGNLSVAELNSSCVLFSWLLPADSGADRFKIAYGMLHGPNGMTKLEIVFPNQQTELCQHILPGRVFIFAVIAEKSRQISEPATLSHTIRPLAPRELNIRPDFEKARFRIRALLSAQNESYTEKCQIWVESEQGGRMEQTVKVRQEDRLCEALFELVPGRRYEISAVALSGQSASTRLLSNKPVEPGFDFDAFGLSLREGDVGSGTLRLEWPQSEVARLRIADLWARIVGRDSHLHFSIQLIEADGGDQQQVETGPTEPEPVLIEGVREGACYKVLLYTVTSSGIVSEQRFEQFIRVHPPQLDLTVGQLSARSATLQAFLFRPKYFNGTSAWTSATPPPSSISKQCHLHVIVSQVSFGTSEVVTDRTLPLGDQRSSPSMALTGLKPWHKYIADAQVNCGDEKQQSDLGECAPKFHRLGKLEFRTQSAQPGPIANFTVRPLNSYSALMRWMSPEEPNGQIMHYIVQIDPQNPEHDDLDDQRRPWTEKVAVRNSESNSKESAEYSAESQHFEEKVLDGLAGGRHYRVEIWPVNEAGQGHGSGLIQLDTPISEPPRPNQQSVEVLSNSVRAQQLSVRIDTTRLSERNGRLIKMALIVAETNENDEVEEDGQKERENGAESENGTVASPTWAVARRLPGLWPPFVALEIMAESRTNGPIDRTSGRFGQKILTLTVGNEERCEERPANAICNGPLKADTSYRFKLRIFTDVHLWADSPWTELIHLEPSPDESAFGLLFVLLFVVFAIVATVAALIYIRRQRKRKPVDNLCHCSPRPCSTSHPGAVVVGKFPQNCHCLPPPCGIQSIPQKTSAHRHNRSNNERAPKQQKQRQKDTKESQWTALKMMMAERAADCLAKLGLDPAAAAASTSNGVDGIDCAANNSSSMEPLRATTAHGNVLCGGSPLPNVTEAGAANSTQQSATLFGTPHHRRSKSLRERTGVDQRLERLPSGPQLRHSLLPWTVKAGAQSDRSRPVQIGDFVEHVRIMSADSDFRFSEEYEDLRTVGLGQSCVAADLTANRAKNRFTNILPYDHSRVKLKPTDDDDGSDYVNASYIPGFNSRREFIAAQGPLPSTRDHFWRLIWEQQVPAVVALTKCIEKGRDKCHQYWPDNSSRSVLYADIEVTLLTESIEYDEFTIRELRLTNMAEPNQPARTVQHLHYQAWPDFGVPDHPAGIVHLARLFRNKLPPSPSNKPTIVHCSAGVGRSGTFIALDRLVQHIESGRPIDVFGTVYEMRLERCHMVQNEQQYIFIHHCLQYVLENFYPFLLCPSSQQSQHQHSVGHRPLSSPNPHAPFGSSISSPISTDYFGGGPALFCRGSAAGCWSSKIVTTTSNNNHNSTGTHWTSPTSAHNQSTDGSSNGVGKTMMQPPPKIEVHHPQRNDGFVEDDEGIAESGL